MTETSDSFYVPSHKEKLLGVLYGRAKSLKVIYKNLPEIPRSSIRRNLRELKHAGQIEKNGTLHAGKWRLCKQ